MAEQLTLTLPTGVRAFADEMVCAVLDAMHEHRLKDKQLRAILVSDAVIEVLRQHGLPSPVTTTVTV